MGGCTHTWRKGGKANTSRLIADFLWVLEFQVTFTFFFIPFWMIFLFSQLPCITFTNRKTNKAPPTSCSTSHSNTEPVHPWTHPATGLCGPSVLTSPFPANSFPLSLMNGYSPQGSVRAPLLPGAISRSPPPEFSVPASAFPLHLVLWSLPELLHREW